MDSKKPLKFAKQVQQPLSTKASSSITVAAMLSPPQLSGKCGSAMSQIEYSETEMDDDSCVVADERNYVFEKQAQPRQKLQIIEKHKTAALQVMDQESTLENSQQNSPKLSAEESARLKLNELREISFGAYTPEQLQFLKVMHNQAQYSRENLQNPNCIEEIKEGHEGEKPGRYMRCSRDVLGHEQLKVFKNMRKLIDSQEIGLQYVSDNQVIRFLNGYKWDEKETLRCLQRCEQVRQSLNCNLMYRHEFHSLFDKNILVYRGYHDKMGRPLLFILTRNMQLNNISVDHLKRFFCFHLDQICSEMPPHVDQLVMVADMYEFGFNNMYKAHFQGTMEFLQTINAERQYCTCIIRQNMVLKAITGMVKKVIDEGTKAKFRLMGSDYKEEMLKFIDPDNLPIEYGGTQPALQH